MLGEARPNENIAVRSPWPGWLGVTTCLGSAWGGHRACIPKVLASRERGGLYHLAAAGETHWHDCAGFVIERAREAGWPVKVAESGITAVRTDGFPVKARRPLNSRLHCGALEDVFGVFRPDWRVGVSRALQEILACENSGARQ